MRPGSVAPLAAVGSDLSFVVGAGGETGDLEAGRREGGRPLEGALEHAVHHLPNTIKLLIFRKFA